MAIVFMPALVVILTKKERDAGRALTQQEVEQIRDNAVAINLPDEMTSILDDSRGYSDIDPENVWEEWQAYRG
ncbi:hypothetical protein [Serratia microhaemolytica]|uniref:hypothetical protein n=1 Tax=Serratia microhaemolytica TaxID=2675110 RepID=UPI000FDF4BDB|nr:hypothetical protein [Serratia microhaemolytica]